MKASAGEVYTVYNPYLKRYTACQVAYIAPPDSVSKEPWAVILSLDWVSDAPLRTGGNQCFDHMAVAVTWGLGEE